MATEEHWKQSKWAQGSIHVSHHFIACRAAEILHVHPDVLNTKSACCSCAQGNHKGRRKGAATPSRCGTCYCNISSPVCRSSLCMLQHSAGLVVVMTQRIAGSCVMLQMCRT